MMKRKDAQGLALEAFNLINSLEIVGSQAERVVQLKRAIAMLNNYLAAAPKKNLDRSGQKNQ